MYNYININIKNINKIPKFMLREFWRYINV